MKPLYFAIAPAYPGWKGKGWYFFNANFDDIIGPYPTEAAARQAMKEQFGEEV